MIESIVPGSTIEVYTRAVMADAVDPQADDPKYPTMIVNDVTEEVYGFLLITNRSNYDISFVQSKELGESGISVTPYGLIIYPLFTRMAEDGYDIVKAHIICCGKYGTLTIGRQDIADLMNTINEIPIEVNLYATKEEGWENYNP